MKWGQWAATRADIFPPDMCAELAKLQTKAPAHSLAHTERTIRHALGEATAWAPVAAWCHHGDALLCPLRSGRESCTLVGND